MLSKKIVNALCKSIIHGTANCLVLLPMYFGELLIYAWKRPFRDSWVNISQLLSATCNLAAIMAAASPILFPDFDFPPWISDAVLVLSSIATGFTAFTTLFGSVVQLGVALSNSTGFLSTAISTLAAALWVRLQLLFFARGKRKAQAIVDNAKSSEVDLEQTVGTENEEGHSVHEVRMDLIWATNMVVIADDQVGFKDAIRSEVTASVNGNLSKVHVVSLQPQLEAGASGHQASTRVILAVEADVCGDGCDASEIANMLKAQVEDADSQLMRGLCGSTISAEVGLSKRTSSSKTLQHIGILETVAADNEDTLGLEERFCIIKDGEMSFFKIEDVAVYNRTYDTDSSVPVFSIPCDGRASPMHACFVQLRCCLIGWLENFCRHALD